MKQGRGIFMWAMVALAAGAAMACQARAQVAFTAPQILAAPEAGTSQIAVDPQGGVTVTWIDYEPATESTIVAAQRWSPTGLPSPVQTLAVVPRAYPQCVCPKVTIDSIGRGTVVWQGNTSEGRQIESARIGADGIAEPAQILSPPGVEGWYMIPLANKQDEVVVVWQSSGPDGGVESVILNAAGVAGEVHRLSAPDEGRLPVPAASPAGDFHVAWTGSDGIRTTQLDGEGAPEEVKTVSPAGEAAGAADMVVDSQGRATIAWWRSGVSEAKAVRLAPDGTPGTDWTLSLPGQETYEPRLAIDSHDRVTAVWQSFDDEVFDLRIPAGGSPGPAQQLSPEGHLAGEPQVVAAPDGRVVVSWTHPSYAFAPEPECLDQELNPADDVVRTAFIGADGQLSQILDASPHGQQSFVADLALDPLGLPWVTWTSFDGTYFCESWDTRAQLSHALESKPTPEESPQSSPVAPGPPSPEPASPVPTLHLAKKGRAQNDRIILRARCQGAAGTVCSGLVRLNASAASFRSRGAVRSGQWPASLVLARSRYRVPGGKARTLRIPVFPAISDLLAEAGPDWIAASARGPRLTPTSLSIRLVGGAN